jgi:hypothetical protein
MSQLNHDEIIKTVETMYPGTCEEFKTIQREQYEVFCKKQFDYGPHNISLGSDLYKKEDITASISAIVVRLNDKIQRLINLVLRKKTFETANEPIFDAFNDTSVYCIIAEIVKRNKWCK